MEQKKQTNGCYNCSTHLKLFLGIFFMFIYFNVYPQLIKVCYDTIRIDNSHFIMEFSFKNNSESHLFINKCFNPNLIIDNSLSYILCYTTINDTINKCLATKNTVQKVENEFIPDDCFLMLKPNDCYKFKIDLREEYNFEMIDILNQNESIFYKVGITIFYKFNISDSIHIERFFKRILIYNNGKYVVSPY